MDPVNSIHSYNGNDVNGGPLFNDGPNACTIDDGSGMGILVAADVLHITMASFNNDDLASANNMGVAPIGVIG